ncbi:unnamed protein product, partial [Heterosigma akashiwo]
AAPRRSRPRTSRAGSSRRATCATRSGRCTSASCRPGTWSRPSRRTAGGRRRCCTRSWPPKMFKPYGATGTC